MNRDIIKRNNIHRFGSGSQTMMFAHGYGCDQNMWRFVAPRFEKDFKILLFDHVGSGQSDESAYDFEKYNSLQGYANDIIEICEALELKEVIFVGHSVSCMIGLLAAKARPELFSKLIMIGPSPGYINDGEYFGGFSAEDIENLISTLESNYLGWSEHIAPVIVGDADQPEFSKELENSFCRMNPAIGKHFAKVTFTSDNRADLPDIPHPVLVVQSHPDAIAPVETGKYVAEHIPKCTYVELNSAGHCPHLTAPDKTITAMANYLNE